MAALQILRIAQHRHRNLRHYRHPDSLSRQAAGKHIAVRFQKQVRPHSGSLDQGIHTVAQHMTLGQCNQRQMGNAFPIKDTSLTVQKILILQIAFRRYQDDFFLGNLILADAFPGIPHRHKDKVHIAGHQPFRQPVPRSVYRLDLHTRILPVKDRQQQRQHVNDPLAGESQPQASGLILGNVPHLPLKPFHQHQPVFGILQILLPGVGQLHRIHRAVKETDSQILLQLINIIA